MASVTRVSYLPLLVCVAELASSRLVSGARAGRHGRRRTRVQRDSRGAIVLDLEE
ncbi:MAG: hypothetical protein J0L92_08330 [Deltaproteobacteria bacterium]|nr:hypothetical protein [Deltaproteobacteria bacterium]